MNFEITSEYEPTGDQPQAIDELSEGVLSGEKHQTLLGVTGSGKTFTMANVINRIKRPTLVLSHNKTLAAQLYGELKQFFPNNAVDISSLITITTNLKLLYRLPIRIFEKDLSINEEIEKLRLSATSALLSGRRDVVVVASVSCIYGIGNPDEFGKNVIKYRRAMLFPEISFYTAWLIFYITAPKQSLSGVPFA